MLDATEEWEGERGYHPCYRHGCGPQSWERCFKYEEAAGQRTPLLDAKKQAIHRANHDREIRLCEPWRVPLLFGKLPHPPKKDADVGTKGLHALLAMILLRPWRCKHLGLKDWICAPPVSRLLSAKDLWQTLHTEYVKWNADLRTRTKPYFSRGLRIWLPASAFSSDDWWACRVHRIAVNKDMALAHPYDEDSKVSDVKVFPLEGYHETSGEEDDDKSACSEPRNPPGSDSDEELDGCDEDKENQDDDDDCQGRFPEVKVTHVVVYTLIGVL